VEAYGDAGVKWWKKTMQVFRRPQGRLDREQVEDAELARKEAQEGLPANVLDFKDHPYYALERHLKRHEVIHPKRVVGKVNAGSAKKPRMEPVYRRRDVLVCRSADKWYRQGREIKPGEQPIKYVPARRRRDQSPNPAQTKAEQETTGLYAGNQTTLYIPPAIDKGRVPRNAYGNLDIYTPSMIPAGGTHIRDAQAARAARLLRVDYADAVTGFSFKGRHGTAVIDGIIVATPFADAVRATLDGFVDEAVEEESRARSLEALRRWKRFLTGLRIAHRVSAYADQPGNDTLREDDAPAEDVEDSHGAGGFIPDMGQEAMPTAGRFSFAQLQSSTKKPKKKVKASRNSESDEDEGEYDDGRSDHDEGYAVPSEDMSDIVPNNVHQAGEYQPENHARGANTASSHNLEESNDSLDMAGGFLPEEEEDSTHMAGGFLPKPIDDDTSMAGGFVIEDAEEAEDVRTAQNDDAMSDYSDRPSDHDSLHEDDFGSEKAAHTGSANPTGSTMKANLDTSTTAYLLSNVSEKDGSFRSLDHHGNATKQFSIGSSEGIDESQHEPTPGLCGDLSHVDEVARPSTSTPEGAANTGDDDSILSHDPEDEDAEPDWLESD